MYGVSGLRNAVVLLRRGGISTGLRVLVMSGAVRFKTQDKCVSEKNLFYYLNHRFERVLLLYHFNVTLSSVHKCAQSPT